MAKKIGMISLGCAKNTVDAERMLYSLKEYGYEITSNVEGADAVIINTCGFIESAKQESIGEIIEVGKLKNEGKVKAVVVTGCLAERYREEISKEMPEVDAVLGIGGNREIAQVVKNALEGEKTTRFPEKENMPLSGGRIQSTPKYYAYLKVADGCDNRCSYCAIPLIRGRFRSKPMEEILDEAKELAENGVKELLVIAQDTTRYGEDLYGKLMLPKLLKELCNIEKIKWVRVLYCYPDRVTDELLETIASEEKIVKYMDLPLQHCSEGMLKAMNRRGTRESISFLLSKIRKMVPGIALRTTLITGFPGETEEDFEELCQLVEETRFERLGCFAYSREEDTPAFEMENQLPEEVKTKRQEIIMEAQHRIMEENCEALIGKTITVLCEGYDKFASCYYGRSQADAPEVDGKVFFTSDGEIKPNAGEFVDVLIEDRIDFDPLGTVVK